MVSIGGRLMPEFILSVKDLNTLTSKKEQIKNQVMENITWQQRIELYRQVQLINERIEELRVTS
jgi:hypothetical protein